jgi:excinuclease ABC subunit B
MFFLAYNDFAYRISFFGNEIENIYMIDPVSGIIQKELEYAAIYPANIYVSPKERLNQAMRDIQDDLVLQLEYFRENGKHLEAKRLEERVNFDLEMMRELGYCSGIENYSRYMDRRQTGERPFCLLDYFPKDFLLVVDESHVSMPQIRAMYGGDRSRKTNLVEYGFRLPSALDNRPLQFEEFQNLLNQVIYVSATPTDFEIRESDGVIVEQLIRPTGLLDPVIEVRPCINQVDDLLDEIDERVKMGDRVLVTTLTKRMSEELAKYLSKLGIKCQYIHSEVKTLDRVEILRNLRLGKIDVLIGINLLREGLDLPEVSFVAILDADKEGFLRSVTSMIQTIGRAARNERGKVIMYADKMTESMRKTIEITEQRREKQIAYNLENHITPTTVIKSIKEIIDQTSVADAKMGDDFVYAYNQENEIKVAADPVFDYMSKDSIQKAIKETEKSMQRAAKEMDFLQAAHYRDQIEDLKKRLILLK